MSNEDKDTASSAPTPEWQRAFQHVFGRPMGPADRQLIEDNDPRIQEVRRIHAQIIKAGKEVTKG